MSVEERLFAEDLPTQAKTKDDQHKREEGEEEEEKEGGGVLTIEANMQPKLHMSRL